MLDMGEDRNVIWQSKPYPDGPHAAELNRYRAEQSSAYLAG
jgi:hypothetical protein